MYPALHVVTSKFLNDTVFYHIVYKDKKSHPVWMRSDYRCIFFLEERLKNTASDFIGRFPRIFCLRWSARAEPSQKTLFAPPCLDAINYFSLYSRVAAGKLAVIQVSVKSVFAHKLIMAALFNHFAIVHDENSRSVSYRRKPMSDNKVCSAAH